MRKDINGSVIPLLIAAVIIVIGVAGFLVFRSNKDKSSSSQTASTSEQASVETAKSETEKKFETYIGEDYDRYYMAVMIGHHQGAIDMAKLVPSRAKHTELKEMANEIITAQQKEIDDMIAWQKAWGFPASTGEMMEDHSAMGVEAENLTMTQELEKLSGDAFDKRFVELMIKHHESAIAMSRPASKNAQRQEIKTLASAVINAQEAEISQMRAWISDWGYED